MFGQLLFKGEMLKTLFLESVRFDGYQNKNSHRFPLNLEINGFLNFNKQKRKDKDVFMLVSHNYPNK